LYKKSSRNLLLPDPEFGSRDPFTPMMASGAWFTSGGSLMSSLAETSSQPLKENALWGIWLYLERFFTG